MRVARQRDVDAFASRGDVGEKRRSQKRHVAGYHQHLFCRRFNQRRIQTSERSSPGDSIRHESHVGLLRCRRLAPDDENVRSEATEQ